VATKAYLARGKDGYDAFVASDVELLIGDEGGPILPTLVRNHFRVLAALSGWGSQERVAAATSPARSRALAPVPALLRRMPTRGGGATKQQQPRYSLAIAPVVDGRIRVLQGEPQLQRHGSGGPEAAPAGNGAPI